MLSELIFGKKLHDITIQDLETFFSEEREETSLLEFKSGEVSIDKIYKEVCAFLNTEGGVLIIGTPREDNSNGKVVCKGELISCNYKGKDRLMTSIVSNISPPPTEIKIQELHSRTGSHFIIEIPQSMTPPHQCNRDGRYYIRMEGIANHAPHGVVEALFFKRQKGKLAPFINLSPSGDKIIIKVSIDNLSPHPTEKVSYNLRLYNIMSVPMKQGIAMTHSHNSHIITQTFDMVMWKGLGMATTFLVQPNNTPFYCSVTAWSKDAELVMCHGVFDGTNPIEGEAYDIIDKKDPQYYIDMVKRLIKGTDSNLVT